MTKGLFFVFHGFAPYNGISKKIMYQIEAFKQCGIDMKLCYYDVTLEGERVWKIEDKVILSLGYGIKAKLKKRFLYGKLSSAIISEEIDFIYIRSMHNANPFTINFVKKLHKASIKILMEIPTYPYDREYSSFKRKFSLYIDRSFRGTLAGYIDKIVTFSDYDTIFGTPTIKISNGIDFDRIKLKKNLNDTSKTLNMTGVAEIHFWHGYDRLIRGVVNYYKSNPSYKVYFNIVGDFFSEIEREAILSPIKENNLEQYVILYGNRQGEELDEIFEKTDIGVGSLARHRSGITNIKTLKNREYAARGVPFIYSEYDEDFENKPYIMKVPADETPVNISEVIDFYNKLTVSPAEIRDSIKNLSWKEQINKVIINCALK